MPRPTLATINTNAFKANYERAKALSEGRKVIAVVKANAYGHGATELAKCLKAPDGLAVAITEEATALFDAGIRAPIFILEGPMDPADVVEISRIAARPVIHNTNQLDWVENTKLPAPLDIWFNIDTGMSRLGFPLASASQSIFKAQRSSSINSIVLMTHLACTDEENTKATQMQNAKLEALAREHDLPVSISNSAAMQTGDITNCDWVRAGILLYGSSSVISESASQIGFQPVMTLSAKVMAIRTVQVGESVGYSATWTAKRTSRIATVPIGYADGYPRHAKSGTPVLIDGERAPLAGRVSMDMITVDVTDLPQCDIGSEVELWGPNLCVDEVAHYSGTISYQLMCAVSKRVVREYLSN